MVTIDAMGCQTEIAEKIVDQVADYMLAVKGNQGVLAEDVANLFVGFDRTQWRDIRHEYTKTVNKDHARLEIRECWVVAEPEYLTYVWRSGEWKGLPSLVRLVSQRQINGQTSIATRYFITSLLPTAKQAVASCRDHRTRNVAFHQNLNRVHKDHAPQNPAVLQHIALNLIKHETSSRAGVKTKHLRAGWDDPYFLKILTA